MSYELGPFQRARYERQIGVLERLRNRLPEEFQVGDVRNGEIDAGPYKEVATLFIPQLLYKYQVLLENMLIPSFDEKPYPWLHRRMIDFLNNNPKQAPFVNWAYLLHSALYGIFIEEHQQDEQYFVWNKLFSQLLNIEDLQDWFNLQSTRISEESYISKISHNPNLLFWTFSPSSDWKEQRLELVWEDSLLKETFWISLESKEGESVRVRFFDNEAEEESEEPYDDETQLFTDWSSIVKSWGQPFWMTVIPLEDLTRLGLLNWEW
jgi:hypothetical protein